MEKISKEEAIRRILFSHRVFPFATPEAFEARLKALGFKVVPDVVPEWAKDKSGRWA